MTFGTINTTQKIHVVLEKTTSTGAALDASPAPVWSAETGPSDPATVAPNPDGFEADLISGAVDGDTVFLISAFSGGVPVNGEYTLTVVPKPELGELVITNGAITPK